MTFKMVSGLRVAACITIAGGLFACSSTNSSGVVGDGGGTVFHPLDSGGPVGDDDSGGTVNGPGVGNACTTPADCVNDAGPAGLCSNNFFTAGPLFPTAVCLSANCTVPADPNQIGICGNNALPGLCQAGATGSAPICFPLCTISGTGTVAGCLTNDACKIEGLTSTGGTTEIIGICQPGCTADAQCPSGTKCDTYQAVCVATPEVFSQAFGTSCDPNATTQACYCIGSPSGTTGFCSSSCVTGSGSCPVAGAGGGDGGASEAGTALPYVCSAQLGGINASDAGISFATQPNGLDGLCFQACDTAADCTLSGSTCTPDPAGGAHKGVCTL